MSILCVGSVALDSVETPSAKADRVLGGSAVFFASSATLFAPVGIVGVVGDDYPLDELDFLANRGADLSGIEQCQSDGQQKRHRRRGVFRPFRRLRRPVRERLES